MITKQMDEGDSIIRRKRARFSRTEILRIVKEVESGIARSVIVNKYNTARSTIADWMRDYGSVKYHAEKQRQRSEAERTSVLRALADKRMTMREAMVAFRVSSSAIKDWQRQYKREKGELASVMGIKKSSKKKHEVQGSEQEKTLQKALDEAQLKIQALNTLIDVAEDKFKIEIRKKAGAKRSSE
jgi:transposase